jgi:HAD superfamily hydrolase (TIGR01549 family)
MARLALFDLDNTVLDRAHAFERWMDLFVEEHHLPFEARATIHRVDVDGTYPREHFLAELRQAFSLTTSLETLIDRYYVDYIACFDVSFDTIEALRSLRIEGWKLAVVTNGPPTQLEKLRTANLVDEFDAICISDVIGSHKPEVAIFQEAARRCGLPLQGWMVGDSPSADIAGGHKAGLRTIWMDRHRTWSESDLKPDFVASSIPEAVEFIRTNSDALS